MSDPRSLSQRLQGIVRRLGPPAGGLLLLPLFLVTLPLWAVSAVTRLLTRHLEPTSLPWQALIQYEPVVGARTRPNLDAYGRGEDLFHLTTDNEGWRGQTSLDEADLVVFGDSFAFGHGVDDKDLHAEQIPDLRVKPIASDAYSMVHSVLWMQRLAPRLRQKTVAWFVYCGNDLADNLRPNHWGYRMPFLKENPGDSWEIVSGHVSPEPWRFRSPAEREDPRRLFAELCTPSCYSDRVFAAADHLIGEAAKLCEGAEAKLIVFSIPISKQVKDPTGLAELGHRPDRVDPEMPDRRLGASCERRGIPFVPLYPHLRRAHYWKGDIHWNRSGHRAVARILSEAHERYGHAAPSPGIR